jgi:hypothetical protein
MISNRYELPKDSRQSSSLRLNREMKIRYIRQKNQNCQKVEHRSSQQDTNCQKAQDNVLIYRCQNGDKTKKRSLPKLEKVENESSQLDTNSQKAPDKVSSLGTELEMEMKQREENQNKKK